jgi:hypothetical protein
MILLFGESPTVALTQWNGHRIWQTGVSTPWSVVQTYMPIVILVTDDVSVLRPDMRNIYVITTNHTVLQETVLRGGYCLIGSMLEGLWRLKDLLVTST